MTNIWDERFSEAAYVYGEDPNEFFAEQLSTVPAGPIILPCEGEGRNAAHAASEGWLVRAFDSSEAGKTKALNLAQKKKVNFDYKIADAAHVEYPESSAEIVAFIYAHFPPSTRHQIHQKAVTWLKPGGRIVIEAFNTKQLQNKSGGPRDLNMLYTEELMRADFKTLQVNLLYTRQTILNEGKYHIGLADVIRFVGIKA
jgi:SAM-dependent methyltransferase